MAPAGFGKTTLARQYLASRAGSAVCDCTAVRDDLDLARRLMPAMATAAPEREAFLTQIEMGLGDGGASIADRVNRALEAWQESGEGVFVFENAEHIGTSSAAREFFARLLSRRPEGRSVVVCSRESLRVHLTRFAAPHEIMVLRAADLAFDRDDVAAIFSPFGCDATTIDRIFAVSQGWPIAVLLLKRFAAEGRIASLLDRLDDIAFDELHDYLADEVLASLDERLVRAVFACASIPAATAAELRVVLDDPSVLEDLAEYSKHSPFIERTRLGAFTVHPLLASLLLEYQEEERHALVQRVAQHHEEQRSYVRAAELYLAIGAIEASARALGKHEVLRDPTPSMAYARVLASFDRPLITRYPRLWGVTALMRLFTGESQQLLEEAESLWRTAPTTLSAIERYYIFAFRVLFLGNLGRFAEAKEHIAAFSEYSREQGTDTFLAPFIAYMRALILARDGEIEDAERDLTLALASIQTMDVLGSGSLLTLGADIARVRGERAAERQLIERAIERARGSGLSNFLAFDLAEAVLGAWIAGEDSHCAKYAAELDSIVERDSVRGFAYFAAVARGRSAEPTATDHGKYICAGRLVATAAAVDTSDANRLARAAMQAANATNIPYMQTLAALAVLLTDASAAHEYGPLALEHAMRVQSPPLHAAVRAAIARQTECGILTPFVARLTRQRLMAPALLDIAVTTGSVMVDGKARTLSGRELELLIALALRRETVSRGRLCHMLWPDLEENPARNALSVCLHRLRLHLGNEDCIVRDGEGYRLADDARVDLWDLERSVGSVLARTGLHDGDRAVLRTAYDRLCAERPARMSRWEWFAPTERRLNELRLEVSSRLATDALERQDYAAALAYAASMIAYDPFDEPAREIAIRAHLLAGDRAAALRLFRQYRETLLEELECEPSPALTALLNA